MCENEIYFINLRSHLFFFLHLNDALDSYGLLIDFFRPTDVGEI